MHLANGWDAAATVVRTIGWKVVTLTSVAGSRLCRLSQTDQRRDCKTEQAELFHLSGYGHARIAQTRSKRPSAFVIHCDGSVEAAGIMYSSPR